MLPVVSDTRSFWEEVERVFDPKRPAQDPALFAERDPKYNHLATAERRLRRPSEDQKYLVTGTVGNGKTSELFHLSRRLVEHRVVIFVDLWRHFESRVRDPSALDRLEPWELVGLLGLAVIRAGTERFNHTWDDEPKALETALKTLRRRDKKDGGGKIDVVALAKGLAIAAGGVVGASVGGPVAAAVGAGAATAAADAGLQVLDAVADAATWDWTIGLPGQTRRSDQDADVRRLLDTVNRLVMSLQQGTGRRLLLVVDCVDRVRDAERLEVLFVNSSLLGELVCDEVFTAPLDLLDGPAFRTVSFRTYDLCNVPVLNQHNPADPGPGLSFFRDLVQRRLKKVGETQATKGKSAPSATPIPQAVVDRLAYFSGGVVREFIRMIALAASEAWELQVAAIDDSIVQTVLEDARRLKELRITREEIDLLSEVIRDPHHRLPSGKMAQELLREQRLLPYPNDTPWYFPHPLLTLALLPLQSGSAQSPG